LHEIFYKLAFSAKTVAFYTWSPFISCLAQVYDMIYLLTAVG